MKKNYLLKFSSLNEKILFLITIVFFLFTRLFNLSLLPIFCDEAIYIRWAQIIKSVPELKFIPLSDGKQPLFMWLMVPFLKIFPDPLFAGRIVSVFSGLLSLIGIFFLSFLIFSSKRTAFFASLIYIVLPYTLFFDRMALVDSLLMSLGIWTLILGILVINTFKLKWGIIGGIILGLAFLTKTPAIFFIFLLFPLVILVEKINFKNFLRTGFLLIVFIGISLGIYNLLRLSPSFYMINLRNKDYIFSFKEILTHPHDPLLVHLKDIADWFPNLFTWPILFLSILGFFWGMIKKPKETLVLGSWCLLPLFVQSFIAKVFNSRYLLFTIFPLTIFGGFFFERLLGFLKRLNFIKIILLFLVFFPALKYDFFLLTSPVKAPLTAEMRRGYLSDWTSGWGIKEVKDYLKEILEKEKEIVVGTEGFWGTLPDGLQIYFDKEPRIKIIGVGLDLKEIPQTLKEAFLKKTPTFLVGNQSRLGVSEKEGKELELIFKIPKPISPEGKHDYFLFYRLK